MTKTAQLRRAEDPAELGGDPRAPENADAFKAFNDLAALEQAGNRFAISELTITECLVPVFGPNDRVRLRRRGNSGVACRGRTVLVAGRAR